MHSGNSYARWAQEASTEPPERFPKATSVDELKARPNSYRVATPAECIALATELGPNGILRLQPLIGGLHPDIAWQSLDLFEQKVLPHIEVVRADRLLY
jgi:hypothetical protein